MSIEQEPPPHHPARAGGAEAQVTGREPQPTGQDTVESEFRRQIQDLSRSLEKLRATTQVRIQAAAWAAVIMAAVLASTAATWLTDVSADPNYLPSYEQSRTFSLWDAPGAHVGLNFTPAAGAAKLVIASLVLMLVLVTVAAGSFRVGWVVGAGIASAAAIAAEVHFGASLSGQSTEIGTYHTGAGFILGIVATIALVIWALVTALATRWYPSS